MKLADARLQMTRLEKGEYGEGEGPRRGLAVARMMAHITYLSDHGMEEKFGGSKDWIQKSNLNLAFSDTWITRERSLLIDLMRIHI